MSTATDLEALLRRGLETLGLSLPDAAAERLLAYVALLGKWNRAYNLTAVREPQAMVTRHLLDSLAVLPHLHGATVADVGTGAGLPGLPLALASPERRFVLLDGNAKKCRFLTQAVAELAIPNVTVVRARVEDYRPEQEFDTVICRAFATVAQMLALSGHLCARGGRVLAMKGQHPHAELDELPAGFRLLSVVRLRVPGLDAERHLVIIDRCAGC
ncbi:MAG: 16S rRNA (guanine(527)-N(7))-methyltransferase RsmG [Gammaproteobacteria bacterium]